LCSATPRRNIAIGYSIQLNINNCISYEINWENNLHCLNLFIFAANWMKIMKASTKAADGKRHTLPDDIAAVLCPAVAVSVTCNVYLVCAALKLVILTFKLLQFADVIIPKGATVGFNYLNVYSNFLLILKSSLHAAILLLYNRRLSHIVITTVKSWIPDTLQQRRGSQAWDSELHDDSTNNHAHDIVQDARKEPVNLQ
jgi:hypothetical protein